MRVGSALFLIPVERPFFLGDTGEAKELCVAGRLGVQRDFESMFGFADCGCGAFVLEVFHLKPVGEFGEGFYAFEDFFEGAGLIIVEAHCGCEWAELLQLVCDFPQGSGPFA
jgi:hypothetical protein